MTDRYDACIVGAGISGLNALFVASQYLSRDQRIVLVDRRARAGGMWVDTYDYVRLHQPYPFFTAGNIKWALDKEPAHLATKGEVLDHLQHCLEVIKQRSQVTELFGYEFEDAEEGDGAIRIRCRSGDGDTVNIKADKLIKAYGQRVEANEPLEVSSTSARSVSPDYCDMRGSEMRTSNAPVWVIGGGKTGMDTAHALITGQPGREVNLVAGSGTLFTSRDRAFPSGLGRWWGHDPFSTILMEMARRFDGTNESEVIDWYSEIHGIRLPSLETENLQFGILSEAENDTIAAGLNEVVRDHFVDVVDRDGRAEMVLRSGDTRPFVPGSWVVNCTGYIHRGEHPYEPYASSSGNVLSVQTRSSIIPFPLGGLGAYYLTHLMFCQKLVQLPLYELDLQEFQRKYPQHAVICAAASLQWYNFSLLSEALPTSVFTQCGLDPDRWFPIPRRLMATVRMIRSFKRDRNHIKRTLDTIADRFDVRCGPLVGAGRA